MKGKIKGLETKYVKPEPKFEGLKTTLKFEFDMDDIEMPSMEYEIPEPLKEKVLKIEVIKKAKKNRYGTKGTELF